MKRMTKKEVKKNVVPAGKTAGKTASKTVTAKTSGQSGKKSVSAKKTVAKKAVVKKTVVKKPVAKRAALVKKSAPAKKVVPVKKAAPVKKSAPAKEVVPAKKAALVKKSAPAKEVVPAKKAAPVKKSVAKKAAPAKKSVEKKVPAVPVVKKAAVDRPAAAPHKSSRPRRKLRLSKALRMHYFNLLMHLRNDYLNQIQFHRDDALASKKDAAGERVGMATHMADLGSDNFRRDLELELLSGEGDAIVMIDEALQRISDSEYGICVDCGCEIGFERLDAKPYARFCTKCKALREQGNGSVLRYRRR